LRQSRTAAKGASVGSFAGREMEKWGA